MADGEVINGKYKGKPIYIGHTYDMWKTNYKVYNKRYDSLMIKDGIYSADETLFYINSKTIVDYQLAGSSTSQANPGDILEAGFWFGATGALAASAGGTNTYITLIIEYPDGERSLIELSSSAFRLFQSIAFEVDERKRKGIAFEDYESYLRKEYERLNYKPEKVKWKCYFCGAENYTIPEIRICQDCGNRNS